MRFTVFTPTYNRAELLKQLYQSLQKQTFRDFEWLVVDDGSADHTQELFSQIVASEKGFPVRYVKTENGGKHRAINKGLELAAGELFYIVDSDDFLPDAALEIIDAMEKTIPQEDKNAFAGVCGLKGTANGGVLGTTFRGETLDITALQRYANGVTGDKAEVFYTDLLRRYPFPEFEGENFITEAVVWDRIAADGFKLRFFNKAVMICEYRDDGLTAQGTAIFEKNPKGWGLYLYQCGAFKKAEGIRKWNLYLEYFYAVRGRFSFRQIAENLHIRPVTLWMRLTGMRVFYKLYQ